MTTKTCTNGHVMTGIGFDECPECEAPWIATPTVEEIVEEFEQNLVCYSPKIVSGAGGFYCGHKNGVGLYDIDAMLNWLRTTLTTRQQAYEEGVKAERERCKNLVLSHLRTNTYDGNDARVFKTTVEEVVELLSDNK